MLHYTSLHYITHHAVFPSVPFPVGKEVNTAVLVPSSQPGHLSAGPVCRSLDVWDIDIGKAMPPSLASALYFLVQTMSIILLWSFTTLWCWAVQASWGLSRHPALPWWSDQWELATKVQETSLFHGTLQKGNLAETAGGSFRCKYSMNLENQLKI